LAASSFYVWNPFVAERLVIGHWPLLLAYAALPWVVDGARRSRAGPIPPALVGWLMLGATSAAGGLLTAVAAAVFGAPLARSRKALVRWLTLFGLGVAVNAPWLVAGLLRGADALSDDNGGTAFAAGAEGPLPAPMAVLTLGGIWNAEVVPASREGMFAWLSILVLGVCAIGVRPVLATRPLCDSARYAVLAALAVAVALAGWAAPGLVGAMASAVPGAGLLRDGTRYLPWLAVPLAALFGHGAARVTAWRSRDRVGRAALAAGMVLVPLALLPDLALGASGRLAPVAYPADYDRVHDVVADGSHTGDVLVLPFSSYRAPAWNNGRKALDPLGRYQPRNYVVNDDLFVSGERVAGEDPRVRQVTTALAGATAEERADALAGLGIGLVVTDRTAVGADDPVLAPWVAGSSLLDRPVSVVTLRDVRARRSTLRERVAVAGAWTAVAVVGPGFLLMARRRRGSSTRG
jgi:hypothetical protein